MGLDIYAGTLTRYYSHNWKTVVQQWAEENGYSFNRITPDGEPADNEDCLLYTSLLKPHEEYFEYDYYWNFRMGYSYFYLDQEGRALRYFEK